MRTIEISIAIEESPVTLSFTPCAFYVFSISALIKRDSIAVFLLTGLLWFALPLARPPAALSDRLRMRLSHYEIFRANPCPDLLKLLAIHPVLCPDRSDLSRPDYPRH